MNLIMVLEFLRKNEWTMGNGQCHYCCGGKPGRWAGKHPAYPTSAYEGHYGWCELALCIEELGGEVIYSERT